MSTEASFGETLKAIRAERGLSQDALAKLAKLSRVQVNRLEKDHHEPSLGTIKLLCEVLKVDCTRFISGRAAEKPTKAAPSAKAKKKPK
jgi:transcriptional regulator with XRE-family HTH domain